VLYEVRLPPDQLEDFEPGQEVSVAAVFEGVNKVDVVGTSKGRGFTGVIKRWGFKMPKQTHGTHEFKRHGGAMGAGTYPGRIIKGKKMAGHYGSERVTVLGLRVEKVDAENNLLFLRGAVPGHRQALVRVRASTRG
jgi:large subunit ribosomal protein L3